MNAIQSFENRIWHRRALKRAIRSAYIIWAKSYPAWENAYFDESFVLGEALSVLSRFIDGEPGVGASELVQAWAAQMRQSPQRRKQQSTELAPAARDFLHLLEGEYEYQRNRRQRSLWYKLLYKSEPATGRHAPYATGR